MEENTLFGEKRKNCVVIFDHFEIGFRGETSTSTSKNRVPLFGKNINPWYLHRMAFFLEFPVFRFQIDAPNFVFGSIFHFQKWDFLVVDF